MPRQLNWRSAGKGALLVTALIVLHINAGGLVTLAVGTALMLITLWLWWK
ncbi:MAG: hypothetical protein QOH04_1410 [Sphingomonadales bacterium]|nr:hypothetical protein [Sphingomonadales bacterium]